MTFRDRQEAGRRLAEALQDHRGTDCVVLGLPRGGVPVAFEVASALAAPLDVIIVRKLGLPYQPELAVGAIGEGGVRVLNDEVVRASHLSAAELGQVEAHEREELNRRSRTLRGDAHRVSLEGRTAIVVDDGIATGATARAACQVARELGAREVVLAVPIGSPRTVADLQKSGTVDDVVCLEQPDWFWAVGQGYRNFQQVSDNEVTRLLARAHTTTGAHRSPVGDHPARDEDVEIQAGSTSLEGHLTVPPGAVGTVIFAHGSGSSRHSPRNRDVARMLNEAGLGTLLFDLLTRREEVDRSLVFDVELLAARLVDVTLWLRDHLHGPGGGATPTEVSLGYFGASTGAAAALWAAADPRTEIRAVVSRGGRPDLAAGRLPEVTAPTLLIVGGYDEVVIDLNRKAQAMMRCESELVVVPRATHLFPEPGALEEVGRLTSAWFLRHLGTRGR